MQALSHNRPEEDTGFQATEAILRFAFRVYAERRNEVDECLTTLDFSEVEIGLSILALNLEHAPLKAAMIIHDVCNALNLDLRTLMLAYFAEPVPATKYTKKFHCQLLAFRIWEKLERDRDRWLVSDTILQWAGLPPGKGVKGWAKELGTHQYWILSLMSGNAVMEIVGVEEVLNQELKEMLSIINDLFQRKGWITH